MVKSIVEIQEEYDLELDKIEETINESKAKNVLLQFPDGLKPYSAVIVNYLQGRCETVNFLIWFGSCFGACDVPKVDEKQVDLIIQFGHSTLQPEL